MSNSPPCPVCQTATLLPSDRLCPECHWPLRSEELSTEQLLWVRQMWQRGARTDKSALARSRQIEAQLAQIRAILEPEVNVEAEAESLPIPVELPPIDDTSLRESLDQHQWRAADQLSAQLLLAIAGREQQGYLAPEDLATLPIDLLHHLDQLWQTASDGHFGLTVQKQCHIDLCGNRSRIIKMWPHLGVQLGWCDAEHQWLTYEQLNFSLDAPLGHLPVLGDGMVWFVGGWSGAFAGFTALMSRLA